jgi:hypothetical protein
MPHPITLGNDNRFLGTIHISSTNTIYNAILNRVVQEGQPEVWWGSMVIPVSPRSLENELAICAYNIENGAAGPVLLSSFMVKCIFG